MKNIKILSGVCFAVALSLFFCGNYLSKEVAGARGKISHAQNEVDEVRGVFDITPFTEPLGDELTSSAEGKISASTLKTYDYQMLAMWLHILAALFCVGAITLALLSYVGRDKKLK